MFKSRRRVGLVVVPVAAVEVLAGASIEVVGGTAAVCPVAAERSVHMPDRGFRQLLAPAFDSLRLSTSMRIQLAQAGSARSIEAQGFPDRLRDGNDMATPDVEEEARRCKRRPLTSRLALKIAFGPAIMISFGRR